MLDEYEEMIDDAAGVGALDGPAVVEGVAVVGSDEYDEARRTLLD